MAECAIEIEQSERENHRAQKDLRAQRYMAVWAFIMALAAVATVVVTTLGLIWIKGTLDATRAGVKSSDASVEVAREIGQNQTRAYVDVASLILILKIEPKPRYEIHVVVRNTGLTPCLKYGLRAKLAFFENSGSAPFSVPETGMHVYASIAPQSTDSVCYFPFIHPSVEALSANAETGFSFVIDGTVTYRTLYGEKFETDFSFLAKREEYDLAHPVEMTKFSRGNKLYSRVEE
ncbi:MAG: hypothetical protein P1U53_00290 [Sulfitobacter sp.]|nr:hypothetical protein [Sulfitobacter sp.]